MDKLFSMRVFSRVAETGSFSGVAKDLDCSVGIVSRAVTADPAGGAQPEPVVVNDVEAIRVALLAGAGVSAMPQYFVADDIRAGRLVRLFPDFALQNACVFAVYASRQHIDANIRTFVEFLSMALKDSFDATPGDATRSMPVAPQRVTALECGCG